MITGAGGMLGHDVARAALGGGHEPVALTRSELDITDADAVLASLARTRPDAVINCAAWTDVDGAEADEGGAELVNGAGAGHVAIAAADINAHLIHVSTDYVFDGAAREPYGEDAPTNPLSSYGRSKLAGERAVIAAGGVHAIVRSSWLFGAAGRNFVATMLRLAGEREELAVVDDQTGSPTFTGHLAEALIALAERQSTGVHHIAGAGACTWFRFSEEIFAQTATSCRVSPSTTAEQRRPAPRPRYSVLGVTRSDTPLLPRWQDGLAAYLAEASAISGAPA
ncbi:MAG: dTDP-4-dehydrorhamnose reductase [Solirubrobacterales bacterium]|nr:MAG: dTDP-4-dehydrorhamnose reductase [Solirubrobacterales bacterium]